MTDMEHEEWLEAQKEQEKKRFGWRSKLQKHEKLAEEDAVKVEVKKEEEEDDDDDDEEEEKEEAAEEAAED